MRYFTLVFLLLSHTCLAQNMQGIVTDAATGKPLSPVTVVNVTTQHSVYTNDDGYYSIHARPGELISFSYLGYKPIERTKSTAELTTSMDIRMELTEYQLKEFKFRPGRFTQYQADSAERVSTYKFYLQRRPPSPFASPVSAILEKFSDKAKRTYSFQKFFAESERERFTDLRYNPDNVNQLTGLTGDSVAHFMYAYPMPYDYARAASDLEIKMWIRTNYREWIKKTPIDTIHQGAVK